MGSLIYTATISIDGYAADSDGDFQWSAPGDEVFRRHIDRLGPVSTEILGRRTFELMTYWNAEPEGETWTQDEHEFARRWQGLDHVVASSTLSATDVEAQGARLVENLDLDGIRDIVDRAEGQVEIFGPTTAAPAILAGLVTEFYFFVVPMAVGGGLAAIPSDARLELELASHEIFASGTALLHYVPRS